MEIKQSDQIALHISHEDANIIMAQSADDLAEWWCILNRWGWPDALPNPEPTKFIPAGRRSKLMGAIDSLVGHKACSRAGNKDMTDEEFSDFWAGTFEGDTEAKARYIARLHERCGIDPDDEGQARH